MTDDVVEIAVVCTANVCRSPLAAAMLDAALRERLGPEVPVAVHSRGVYARAGQGPSRGSVEEATARGLDIAPHRAAPVDRGELAATELVLTMTEDHRADVLRLAPGLRHRVFTLRELARLADHLASTPSSPATDSVRAHVRAAIAAADAARPLAPRTGTDPEDVADPIGGPREGYARLGTDLDDLVPRIADLLAPRRSERPAR